MPTLELDQPTANQIQPYDWDQVPDTYPPGRRCSFETCPTILCRYNPGPECFVHTRPERSDLPLHQQDVGRFLAEFT